MINSIDITELGSPVPVKPDYYLTVDEAPRLAEKLAHHRTRWSVWQYHEGKRSAQNQVHALRKRGLKSLQFATLALTDGRFATGVRAVAPRDIVPDVYVVDMVGLIRDRRMEEFLDSLRKSLKNPASGLEIDPKYVKIE